MNEIATPQEFSDICPFSDAQFKEKMKELVAEDGFKHAVTWVMPDIDFDGFCKMLLQINTKKEFQENVMFDFLKLLAAKTTEGISYDNIEKVDQNKSYTMMTNHRDIVLDSALLHKLLFDAGCDTTTEIAIGDNLLKLPWVKDIVRINKSFIVERSLSMRQMLVSSKRLSDYMHFVINEKHDNVWIAQREGRAKDSNDRTQEAILKMMTMGGEGSVKQRLLSLNIVPLAISYEFDPCDFLKAQEFQLRRDVEGWKKGPMDDVISMQTGIMGFKGHIHYHCAPCINEWLEQLPDDMPKADFYKAVAEHIDHDIWRGYRLYPSNFVALDLLEGTKAHADRYTDEDRQRFEAYLQGQMAKIQLPNPDVDFLRERMLTMYANPVRNQMSVL